MDDNAAKGSASLVSRPGEMLHCRNPLLWFQGSGDWAAGYVTLLCRASRTCQWARSQASGRTQRGLAAGETGTRLPASHPTLQSDQAMSKALPVRLAVGTAAVQSGSLLTARRSPGPGHRRPGGQPDVSARQACDSRLPSNCATLQRGWETSPDPVQVPGLPLGCFLRLTP